MPVKNLQLWPKMLSASQIAAFFNYQYIWKRSDDCLDFLLGDNHKRKAALKLPPLVACGQFYLLVNQIAAFFDQYLWKEPIDILDFLLGDNHQRKAASETTTFGCMWTVLPLDQSDCWIL